MTTSRFRKSTPEANPNVSGKESTTSVSSTGSEGSTSSSEGSDIDGDLDIMDDHSITKEESGLSYLSLKVFIYIMPSFICISFDRRLVPILVHQDTTHHALQNKIQ